jgi:eukaryotic-like serine/threonine-protein kinase
VLLRLALRMTLDNLDLARWAVDPVRAPHIPGYLVGSALGTGSAGRVWSAVRASDGWSVAIKVIAPQGSSTGSPVELAVLRGVRHPHVIRFVEDIILSGGAVALVLERASGGSLARVVGARGHLTPAETVTVVTALATTLVDLHRMGVTHGDISPGNVLFHADGRPVLADLGVSQVTATARAEAWGTDGFVDPAVLAGDPAGPASDVYALGALGWFCLAGTAPGHAALRPDLSGLCPDAPVPLVVAIQAALEPDPRRRIGAAALACAAYDSCVAGPVALACGDDPDAGLTHRIRRPARAAPPLPARRSWLRRLSWRSRRTKA